MPFAPTPATSDADPDSGNPHRADARWCCIIAWSPEIGRAIPNPTPGNPDEPWAGRDRNRLDWRRWCARRCVIRRRR